MVTELHLQRRPIRRCSRSSEELCCGLGRRFEHHLLPHGLQPCYRQGPGQHPVPWPCLTGVGWWHQPRWAPPAIAWLVLVQTTLGSASAEDGKVFHPCRAIPSSPMEKSIAQKLKTVWICSIPIAPGLSCDLLYGQAIIRWKLLLCSVFEYISLIIVFSTCTWSENLYYPTTKYKMNSENHQI